MNKPLHLLKLKVLLDAGDDVFWLKFG